MAASFFEHPILNSPYEAPGRCHALDADGQPLDLSPVDGRRESKFITPVPRPRKRRREQRGFTFEDDKGLSSETQQYDPHSDHQRNPPARCLVARWRRCAFRKKCVMLPL